METLKFNVFHFLNKSKKTTVPLVLLCPTFPYWQSNLETTKPMFLKVGGIAPMGANLMGKGVIGGRKNIKGVKMLNY